MTELRQMNSRDVLKNQREEFVYFIACGNYIKIGYSRSIFWRLRSFRTNTPDAKILWVEPGTVRQEKIYHRHFAACRLEGTEWFRRTPKLLDFLRERYRRLRPDLALPELLAEPPQ